MSGPSKECSPSPRVSNTRVLLDDEGLDPERRQAGGEHEAILTSADDQASRVLVLELDLLHATVEPVVTRLVQAVLGSDRAVATGFLLVPLDLPERCEEGERLPVAGAGRRFLKAEEALPAPLGRLVRRIRLKPAGFLVDLGVLGLDDLEVLDGGNAVAREVTLDLVSLDRVEVKVDGLARTEVVSSASG